MWVCAGRELGVLVALSACAAVFSGCSGDDGADDAGKSGSTAWGAVTFDPVAKAPSKLSETGLAKLVDGKLVYHPELIAFDLTMPLFTDYALKRRALWVPAGKTIGWRDGGLLDLPEGSIIIKSFLYAPDLREPDKGAYPIETRVLVRGPKEWNAWPYIWDAQGGDATLKVAGGLFDVAFIDPDGKAHKTSYLVPQRNQCVDCHGSVKGGVKRTVPVGPQARYLNRLGTYDGEQVNQLEHLHKLGLLPDMPAIAKVDAATSLADVRKAGVAKLTGEPLRKAARDYLDINCSACHSPAAVEGQTSQLFLNHDNEDAFLLGVCKAPSSAGQGGFGRKYDIVPGKPDESILVYRLETTTLGAMMPDLGRSLPHTVGIALVRKWIAEMAPVQCNR